MDVFADVDPVPDASLGCVPPRIATDQYHHHTGFVDDRHYTLG